MRKLLQKLRTSSAALRGYAQEREAASLTPFVTALGVACVLILVGVGIYIVWTVPQWEVRRSLDAALAADRARQLELEDAFRKTIT